LRLFVAFDIDEAIRERIGKFVDGVSNFAPDARWVRLESLHVTLKFIGEKPDEFLNSLKQSLKSVRIPRFTASFNGVGFFPTPKSARVFWIGIRAAPELQQLAATIDDITSRLGVPREERDFSPHLTLARKSGASGAPHQRKGDGPGKVFQRLQEKLAAMPSPEFGTMTAREFYVYQSQLSRTGARYTKLVGFALDERARGAAEHSPES
jgi:2'-5' RNA ligase